MSRTGRFVARVPIHWETDALGNIRGSDGFLTVRALLDPGATTDAACRAEAADPAVGSYGSSPFRSRLTINGQDACRILPSADQPPDLAGMEGLVIRHPYPFTHSGARIEHIAIQIDDAHLESILRTLSFRSSTELGHCATPPFPAAAKLPPSHLLPACLTPPTISARTFNLVEASSVLWDRSTWESARAAVIDLARRLRATATVPASSS